MSDLDTRCLDAFPEWLNALADDAVALTTVLDNQNLAEPVRRLVAGAVNYLFKSLDLIPDGIEDLGFIDDAFVFRVAAAKALESDGAAAEADETGTLSRLAEDSALVSEFLGDDFARLERFVTVLADSTVRGRSVADIVEQDAVRSQLSGDLRGWASEYTAPSFSRDKRNLVKLRSFLAAKLPA